MVISVPEGVYTMQAKRSIIKVNAQTYHKAAKKLKSKILNDLVVVTHFHRKYLTGLINKTGKVYYTPQGIKLVGDPTITYTQHRGRKKVYTEELVPYLETLWELSGFRSSIHLVDFIRQNKELLFNKPQDFEELSPEMQKKITKLFTISPEDQIKLLKISSATVDRLLKKTKEACRLAHKYRPHPHASVIKKKIPVESYFDKPKHGPIGYTEIDLVHPNPRGGFCYTLSEVEINTAWTELRALKNKAQIWTHRALAEIDRVVPFRIHSRHVDNGSEFINAHLLAYTQARGIRLTRSRAYHKNDAPYVESRHWTMVRSYVGYRRYDTEREYAILDPLLRAISLRHNYFMPTMKLVHKKRVGGKVFKKYTVNTPYNRVLNAPVVSEDRKEMLREYKSSLSYFKIIDEIMHLQKKLDETYGKKYNGSFEDEEDD